MDQAVQDAATRETAIQGVDAVQGKVNYLVPPVTKPAIYIEPDGTRHVRDDVRHQTRTVTVHNARHRADRYTLDKSGFSLVDQKTAVTDFFDPAEVEATYYAEVEKLIKRETGAEEVVIFDHTLRVDDGNEGEVRNPVRNVHGDYTKKSGPQRVRDLVPSDRVEEWLNGRYAVINVWRSVRGTVESAPLAFVDGATVSDDDFVATDLVYPDRKGEIYGFVYSPNHRWVYFPRLTEDEALMIKTFDSAEDGRVRFSAHAAIDDPSSPADAAPRQSLEIRALVRFPAA